MIKIRRQHSEAFKFKVALAALRGDKTQAELIHLFSICESLIQKWKTHLMQKKLRSIFSRETPSCAQKQTDVLQFFVGKEGRCLF